MAIKHGLPQGQLLPDHVLRRRHRGIVALLWFHVPALLAFGLAMQHTPARVVAAAPRSRSQPQAGDQTLDQLVGHRPPRQARPHSGHSP